MQRKPTPLSIPGALDSDVTKAARRIGISKQDTMRLAIERGLPVLLRALGKLRKPHRRKTPTPA